MNFLVFYKMKNINLLNSFQGTLNRQQIDNRLRLLKITVPLYEMELYVALRLKDTPIEKYKPGFVKDCLTRNVSKNFSFQITPFRTCGTRTTIIEKLVLHNLEFIRACSASSRDLQTMIRGLLEEFDQLHLLRSQDARRGGERRHALCGGVKFFVIDALITRRLILKGKRESQVARIIWEEVAQRVRLHRISMSSGESLMRTITKWLKTDPLVHKRYMELILTP